MLLLLLFSFNGKNVSKTVYNVFLDNIDINDYHNNNSISIRDLGPKYRR